MLMEKRKGKRKLKIYRDQILLCNVTRPNE